jgi:hypothetical protein
MLRKPGIGLLYRIKLLQFDACVSRAELPVHRANLLVAVDLVLVTIPILLVTVTRGKVIFGDPHKAPAALAILKTTIPLWQDGKNR